MRNGALISDNDSIFFLWTFPSKLTGHWFVVVVVVVVVVQEIRTECLPDYVAPSLGHIMG